MDNAECDRAGLALECGVDLGELVLDAALANLQALYFAEPAFVFGLDAGFEIVADFFQRGPLSRVRSQDRTPDTCVTEMILARVGAMPSPVANRRLWRRFRERPPRACRRTGLRASGRLR
jgi:hypothetical protein